MTKPLIEFDPLAPSTIIRFDAPLPSFFEGKNIIDLKVPDEDWGPWHQVKKELNQVMESASLPEIALSKIGRNQKTNNIIKSIASSSKLTTQQKIISRIGKQAEIIIPKDMHDMFSDVPLVKGQKVIKAGQLENIRIPEGKKIQLTKSLTGKFLSNMVQVTPVLLAPRIAIVEKYRLENYLGNYGMGKTISSFYVHPKSKVSLTIKSWKTTQQSYEDASSILDSLTNTASDNFQSSFNSERSKSRQDTENSEYYAEVKGEAGFCGIGSVEAKAGTKGSSSSTREEFSKDVHNTTSAHASESSSKREMQHNVTSVLQTEEGEEEVLVREIENLNAGHVLNFLVRELNQEYHSVLVLKDVRICFFMGYNLFYDEVPLYNLDEFLRTYLKDDDELIKKYRNFILKECAYVKNYAGTRKSILEILKYEDDKVLSADIMHDIENINFKKHYIRIKNERNGIGKKLGGIENGKEIEVEGIPVDVNTVTLKTDGVICSSLLDTGLALDEYSISMQEEALNKEKAMNEISRAEILQHSLARELIENGTDEQVDRFVKIYGPLTEKEEDDE